MSYNYGWSLSHEIVQINSNFNLVYRDRAVLLEKCKIIQNSLHLTKCILIKISSQKTYWESLVKLSDSHLGTGRSQVDTQAVGVPTVVLHKFL